MAKGYICNACDALYDFTHKCDNACSLCTATPPCTKDQTRYCATCNRQFLSEKFFQNHLTLKVKGRLVCQWRQVCPNYRYLVTSDNKHECFKKFCNYCCKNQPSGHYCYVAPLKPSKLSNRFFTFSSIQNVHRTSRDTMAPLYMYRNSYMLSKCVRSVKRWMI
jgi:hypothetical protein